MLRDHAVPQQCHPCSVHSASGGPILFKIGIWFLHCMKHLKTVFQPESDLSHGKFGDRNRICFSGAEQLNLFSEKRLTEGIRCACSIKNRFQLWHFGQLLIGETCHFPSGKQNFRAVQFSGFDIFGVKDFLRQRAKLFQPVDLNRTVNNRAPRTRLCRKPPIGEHNADTQRASATVPAVIA